jgi:CDGSH-type Zn-finger protein
MADGDPHIEVTTHGPYEVSGNIELCPKDVVRSEHGEALTWKSREPLEHDKSYYLCRCGKSEEKPFCDQSHSFNRFDGTETADTGTDAPIKRHEMVGITVIQGEQCEHAGFCVNRSTSWFDMLQETEDSLVRGRLMAMIEKCPSGALAYEIEGEVIEPALPVQISPVKDGPLFVSGSVRIERSDDEPFETRARVTLCRCGESKNKPLCDGTHKEIGFKS